MNPNNLFAVAHSVVGDDLESKSLKFSEGGGRTGGFFSTKGLNMSLAGKVRAIVNLAPIVFAQDCNQNLCIKFILVVHWFVFVLEFNLDAARNLPI
ncbi:unnamed protein product [Hermetia illucens]|uniref:Uncharacterized protein n=1 Tax=Hermetia illucens TaxID=343691 RepID=A0A7R8YU80_HERIL|nr:unnamed protein product [Hermetia illucens]